MINLSIIIVNFNAGKFLKDCVESIVNSKPSFDYEIIIVDNNSSDRSLNEIQDQKLRIIKNKKNLGFSKANNIGVKESSGRYILFLNPDTVVNKEALETIFKFMEEHKDAGASTCRLLMLNGKLDDATHRGFPTPWNSFCHFSRLEKVFPKSRLFAGYSLGWMNLNKVHEIDALAGAFMWVRREAGEEIGWWDEDYFFYGEDIDFCYKLKIKDWKIYFVPNVSILHYKGVSGGIKKESKAITTATSQTKKIATSARFNAMKIFYKKNYTGKYPNLVTWLVFRGINLLHYFNK